MKTKLLSIAMMVALILAAITRGQAQEYDGPCLPPTHGLDDHQSAFCGSTVTQTIALSAGTNWFSSNVEITLAQLEEAIVAGMTNATGTTIKAKDGKTTTYNGTRWRGTLTSLDVAQMYKITATSACEITLEGEPIIPAEHPVTIQANATTWIGFPLGQSMTVTDAFAGFDAVSGDQIKAKNGNSTSFNGTRWRGTLTNLEPGKGYVFSSSSAQDRTLVFPTSK